MADALARRSHGVTLDPAKLTVDQYLDPSTRYPRPLRFRSTAQVSKDARQCGEGRWSGE
jgi:hypothetical protein